MIQSQTMQKLFRWAAVIGALVGLSGLVHPEGWVAPYAAAAIWLSWAVVVSGLSFWTQLRTDISFALFCVLACLAVFGNASVQGHGIYGPGLFQLPGIVFMLTLFSGRRWALGIGLLATVGVFWIHQQTPPMPGNLGNPDTLLRGVLSAMLLTGVIGSRVGLVLERHIQRIRESEKRYHDMFSATPCAVVLHRDGQIHEANAAAARLLGHADACALKDRRLDELRVAEAPSSPANPAAVADAANALPEGTTLLQLRHAQGHLIPVSRSSATVRVDDQACTLSFFTDETERIRAMEALETERKLLETILKASPHPIVIWDEDTHRITFANPAFEYLMAMSRGRLLGQDAQALGLCPIGQQVASTLAPDPRRQSWRNFDMAVQDAQGKTHLLSAALVKIRIHQRVHHLLMGSEVTEERRLQKEHEALLRLDRDLARQASQAKSQFLSRMSHEVRTPLNSILGFSELLQYDQSLTPDQRDNVDMVAQSGKHLLALINDVLDLSKIEAGQITFQIKPLPVHKLLHECEAMARPLAATYEIQLNLDLQVPETTRVQGDHLRLRQVVLNLLTNGIKYNRPGGTVTLGCEAIGDRLRIAVRDTGPGIAPELQAKLFQPFQRGAAEFSETEGTGLGLAIVKSLLEQMGGEIGYHTELGHGTEFWLTLPLWDTRDEAEQSGAPQASPTPAA